MGIYAYSEYWDFEAKLVEAVKASQVAVEMVIERECDVHICHTWSNAINYYPADQLAGVLTLSAEKSIISSNSNYYILRRDHIECADDLMDMYGDNFDQTIYDMWGNGEHALLNRLYDICCGKGWYICYINNAPSELDVKIINALVANKEHDLLGELAKERAWAIYWD